MKYSVIFAVLVSAFLLTGCIERLNGSISADLPSEAVSEAEQTASDTADTTEAVTAAAETTETTAETTATTKKIDPPADLVLRGMETVEAGADITLDEFVTERNVELKNGSAYLDTMKTGEAETEVRYLYEGAEFSKTLRYRVADTVKPYIFNPGQNPYHKVGTAFDINDYIGFGDYFDPNPALTYEGTVDPDTVGSYPLSVTVTDSAGNAVSFDVTIRVVEEKPKAVDQHPRVEFCEFMRRYSGENVRFGIDVSAWQGNVDYKAVREAGCCFVIMRVGYYYSKVKPDDYFRQNLKNAAAAGLDVGVYFYTTDRNEEDVRAHVRWICEQLGGQKLDLPIVFDWEEFSDFQRYGMSIRGLNDVYAAFADEVVKQGYKPMLYSSRNLLNDIWSERIKRSTPVWLAHYVKETNYAGEYAIWQQSPYGRIPGIAGDVDMDIQYLDKPLS